MFAEDDDGERAFQHRETEAARYSDDDDARVPGRGMSKRIREIDVERDEAPALGGACLQELVVRRLQETLFSHRQDVNAAGAEECSAERPKVLVKLDVHAAP